jgi:hypothetical protein
MGTVDGKIGFWWAVLVPGWRFSSSYAWMLQDAAILHVPAIAAAPANREPESIRAAMGEKHDSTASA